MPKPTIVTPGDVYGRLTIVEDGPRKISPSGWSARTFVCKCDCGNLVTVLLKHLRSGNTTSCGCYLREVAAQNGRDSKTHGLSNSHICNRIYSCWTAMIQRCCNDQNPDYLNYGGRGITVCEEWRDSFQKFHEDMGDPPENHSIDRIDNDGNYEKTNCQWATLMQQARNKRNNVFIAYNGETHCLAEWAKRIGMRAQTLGYRIKLGWSAEDAIMTPTNAKRKKSCLN